MDIHTRVHGDWLYIYRGYMHRDVCIHASRRIHLCTCLTSGKSEKEKCCLYIFISLPSYLSVDVCRREGHDGYLLACIRYFACTRRGRKKRKKRKRRQLRSRRRDRYISFSSSLLSVREITISRRPITNYRRLVSIYLSIFPSCLRSMESPSKKKTE